MTVRATARRPRLLVLGVLVALAAAACGVSDSEGGGGDQTGGFDPATTEVEIRFQDSSVPPEYHRSYELTVRDRSAHVVVDSYGDVIADETVRIPGDAWTSFVAGLDEGLDGIGEPESVDDGCTGGTSISVAITSGASAFRRDVSSCGSDRNREIADQLAQVLGPITDAVDLADLTSTD